MMSGPHLSSSSSSHTVCKFPDDADVLWCTRSPAGLAAAALATRWPRHNRPRHGREGLPGRTMAAPTVIAMATLATPAGLVAAFRAARCPAPAGHAMATRAAPAVLA